MTPTQALIVGAALAALAALAIGAIVWAIARDGREECDELHFTPLPADDATDEVWDLARAVGFDDLVPLDARYCPRHADDTISLFRVPDGWMPPIGERRIRSACDMTEPMPVVTDGSYAA